MSLTDVNKGLSGVNPPVVVYGIVDTYADLPDAAEHYGEVWAVTTTTGIWPFNKVAGFYISNGVTWTSFSAFNYPSLSADAPISYDNSTGLISTSMSTNKLIGRYSSGTGEMQEVTIGSGLNLSGSGTLTAIGSGGTVTNVSVATANGFAGTVSDPTTTPDITLSTTATGILKGNGTAISGGLVDLASEVSGVLPETNGGTNQSTYSKGDTLYASAINTLSKLAGNITSAPLVLTSIGDGSGNLSTSWQPLPIAGTFLYYWTNTASDIVPDYKQTTAPLASLQTISVAGLTNGALITAFATEPNNPNILSIPAGQYSCHIHAAKTAGTRDLQIRVEIWEVNSSGTDIAKIADLGPSTVLSGTSAEYFIADSIDKYTLASVTSRIVTKVYAVVGSSGSAPTVAIYVGDGSDSRINLPSASVDASNFVPYTGATANVDLGTYSLIAPTITATTSAGLLIEASNGTDIGLLGTSNTANVTWYGNHTFDAQTANTLTSFGASKALQSLDTATYPSLTEISYVKGVSSAIQTQLNAKQTTTLTSGNILVGNASNIATSVIMSGDITINNSGVTAIGALKVTNGMLAGSIDDSKLNTISTAGKVANSATTATSANTASTIVARDANGLINITTAYASSSSASLIAPITAANTGAGGMRIDMISNAGGGGISFGGSASSPMTFSLYGTSVGAGFTFSENINGYYSITQLQNGTASLKLFELEVESPIKAQQGIIINPSTAGTPTDEEAYISSPNLAIGSMDIHFGDLAGTSGAFQILSNTRTALSAAADGTVTIYDLNLSLPLPVTEGGTGLNATSQGDIFYASSVNDFSRLPKNTSATRYLSNTGTSNNPAWAQIDLSNGVTGTLPVTNGGTGQTTYTNGQLLIGNTTGNTLTKATLTGTTNQITVTNGAGSITLSTPQDIATGSSPTFAGLNLSGLTASTGVYTDASKNLTSTVPTTLTLNAVNTNALLPNTTATYDLGSTTFRWNKGWINQLQTTGILDNGSTIALSTATSITATLTTYAVRPDANNTRDIGTSSLFYNQVFATEICFVSSTTTIHAGGAPDAGATGIAFEVSGVEQFWVTSNGYLQVRSDRGYKSAGLSWSNPSDIRLKENIENFNIGLDTLLKIQPKYYHLRNGSRCINESEEDRHVGIIAQEMLGIYAKSISRKENGFYDFDGNDMIWISINSIKELNNKINDLTKQIEALQNNTVIN